VGRTGTGAAGGRGRAGGRRGTTVGDVRGRRRHPLWGPTRAAGALAREWGDGGALSGRRAQRGGAVRHRRCGPQPARIRLTVLSPQSPIRSPIRWRTSGGGAGFTARQKGRDGKARGHGLERWGAPCEGRRGPGTAMAAAETGWGAGDGGLERGGGTAGTPAPRCQPSVSFESNLIHRQPNLTVAFALRPGPSRNHVDTPRMSGDFPKVRVATATLAPPPPPGMRGGVCPPPPDGAPAAEVAGRGGWAPPGVDGSRGPGTCAEGDVSVAAQPKRRIRWCQGRHRFTRSRGTPRGSGGRGLALWSRGRSVRRGDRSRAEHTPPRAVRIQFPTDVQRINL